MTTRIERSLHTLLLALSVAFIAMFVVIAVLRIGYPYELEWIEGAMVDSVLRVVAGQPLYAAPTIDFVPTVYNPLYFHVSAAFTWLLGPGFLPLRLVSLLATLGVLMLLWRGLSPGNRTAGLVAAGLYAASFRFAGAWMDIAKADALFLFMLLAGFFVGREARSVTGHVASAVCYAAAFYTKQTALPVVLLVMAGQLWLYGPRVWLQWVTFGVLTSAAFVALDRTSDGWYSFYTFDNVRNFVAAADQLYFLTSMRLRMLPALLVAGIYVALLAARRWPGTSAAAPAAPDDDRETANSQWSTAIFAGALVLSTAVVFRQRGTYDNIFMPACLGLAMFGGLAYGDLRGRLAARTSVAGPDPDMLRVLFGAVGILLLQQFVLFVYNPAAQVPTRADREAGDRLVDRIRHLPGRVLVWDHGYYAVLAGKEPHLHAVNYLDTAGAASEPPRTEDNRERRERVATMLDRAVRAQVFDWVITDRPGDTFTTYYIASGPLFEEPDVFYPVTGRFTRPERLMMRNPVARGGTLDLTDPALDVLFGPGWGPAEPWGRHLTGADAEMTVVIEPGHTYRLSFEFEVSCGDGFRERLHALRWNGALLHRQWIQSCGEQRVVSLLDAALVIRGRNLLRLEMTPAASGADSATGGQAQQTEPIAVREVRFEQSRR